MDKYYRLMWTDETELSDYILNPYSLTNAETNTLINDKEANVIADMIDEDKYPIYADLYGWVPDAFLEQLYQHILRTVDAGYIKFFLDHPVDNYKWGIELLVGMLEAYKINDYRAEYELTTELHILPKELSRTTSSQALGDMSLNFESERLSMNLQGPFEQFLSTLPNGIEILNKYKSFQNAISNMAIV